jgi:hypothetical protein
LIPVLEKPIYAVGPRELIKIDSDRGPGSTVAISPRSADIAICASSLFQDKLCWSDCVDKPLLRSTLKKLRALPLDKSNHPNVMMAPQEMLDFLAMRAGIKPVALIGRGFDDPQWIEGAVAFAQKVGLHVIEGPPWDAGPGDQAAPDWFREHLNSKEPGQNFYVCRTVADAAAVKNSFEMLTMDEEARLLGYPPCCVRAHYERDALCNSTFYKMVERAAKGDAAEIKRIVVEDVGVSPETAEEKAAFEEATTFVPAKFTSFHMCDACAADPESPANKLSKKYKVLAETIDTDFAAELARTQEGLGRA